MKNRFRGWSDVRVFLAVYRAGSTLAASRELGIAQPTVARRIEALEHELGVPLFHLDTRGARPSEAAKALLAPAEALEAAAAALAETARRAGERMGGVIRITAAQSTFTENFAAILSEFTDEHPDLRFEFVSAERTLDLSAGEADVAIRHAREITDPNLICRKLSVATGTLYAAPRYAAKYGLPRSPEELPGHRVIFGKAPSMLSFYSWLMRHVPPEAAVMRCESNEELMTALAAGIGIAPLGSGIGDPHPTLIRCFPPPPGTEVTTWLLVAPEAYRRPEVRAFTAFFAPRYGAFLKAQKAEHEAMALRKERALG